MKRSKIKISHEVPISLLDASEEWNDYQYALVHLFKYPKYKNYFKDYLGRGGKVILDNSLFELKSMFDPEVFADAIRDLQPSEYIIPDAWEDTRGTVDSVKKWVNNPRNKDLPGRSIGVLQGETWEGLKHCFDQIHFLVDKIAISFKPIAFGQNEKENKNFLLDCAINRYAFLNYLYKTTMWNITKKPIHLLGCSLPQEFEFYKNAPFRDLIESIDTSNPITHAYDGISYTEHGLTLKTKTSIEDILNKDPPDMSILKGNVSKFRSFVND